MEALSNLDLLSVGIAIAGISVLGLVIFLSNRKSITNQAFLLFALITSLWGIANYLNYQSFSPEISFWILRITIFFGVWHSFSFFHLAYVFPQKENKLTKNYKYLLIPIVSIESITTLTPLVFYKISEIIDGKITKIDNGPGIIFFSAMVLGFVISGISILIKKTIRSSNLEKNQFIYVLCGVITTFGLLMTFNFILPAFFENPNYIPLGAIFILPFIVFTAYAIFKHRLLNVRVIATEVLAFVLSVVTLFEVVLSKDLVSIIFRAGVFLAVFGFSILLIKSVRKEVEQREQLQVLTQELEEFVGFAAHQVKGPMNNMKGFAQLIEDGSYGQVSPEVKDAVLKIKNNADQTLALVTNLLNVRKIESGEFLKDFNFETIDFAGFLRNIVDEYRISAGKKHLALSFSSSLYNFPVRFDRQKIHEVIKNLIENSIKYTDKGFIKVGLEDEGDKVLISIIDSGRGLSKELREKLFQRFMRDEQTKKEIQGTGLGLFIAKQIVEAHHGEIWAESDGEGQGSRFYVRLSKNI